MSPGGFGRSARVAHLQMTTWARPRFHKVLAPAATVRSRVAQTSSYRKLGTTAHPYYWLCLTAPPVTQNLRGQAPIAFLSRALGTPSLAAALSTVLRCFSKGCRSRIFVKMSAVFSSVPRYLTVTNPAPRISRNLNNLRSM